jgi:hypothetical protein
MSRGLRLNPPQVQCYDEGVGDAAAAAEDGSRHRGSRQRRARAVRTVLAPRASTGDPNGLPTRPGRSHCSGPLRAHLNRFRCLQAIPRTPAELSTSRYCSANLRNGSVQIQDRIPSRCVDADCSTNPPERATGPEVVDQPGDLRLDRTDASTSRPRSLSGRLIGLAYRRHR